MLPIRYLPLARGVKRKLVKRLLLTFFFLVSISGLSPAIAEIGDPTILTDHPQYPGEGAFQTPEGCAQWATLEAKSDHDRALALFNWILTHQWHNASPQEWNLPGVIPGQRPDDTEMVVYDANRGRFSYGYGLCGTVHAWNEVYWKALGLPARRRAFPGHTNSEVFVDNKWRAFDTDMAGLVFNRDGSVAGYEDIARDVSLVDQTTAPWPHYPFAWPEDFKVMQAGWKQVAAGGNWYSMYASGYAAQPGVVHVRRGETFTRYFDPDTFGGPSKRRFWHRQPGGPNRLWTFANGGTPFHDGAKSNCRGQTTYGNAVFEYAPDLTADSYLEGVTTHEHVAPSATGLRAVDGLTAAVVFEHFSPYVICGDPVDDEDPMQHAATDGLVVTGTSQGEIKAQVSADQGQTWHELPAQRNDLRWDLTETVKGHYGWRLKLSWFGDAQIKSLRMTTTCQMSQAIYPRLKPGGSRVTYRNGGRAVVPVLPRLEDEAATVRDFEGRSLRSTNLDFAGRRPGQRSAYTVRGPQPAAVVFRVNSPTSLVGLSAAARFQVRSPSPKGAQYGLSWSTDNGATWKPLGNVALPEDNEFSSGWVYGSVNDMTGDARTALVRVELYGGGSQTGLITAELYGLRKTAPLRPATVTYGWTEDGKALEHTVRVPAGVNTATSLVPTGKAIRDRFVRIAG